MGVSRVVPSLVVIVAVAGCTGGESSGAGESSDEGDGAGNVSNAAADCTQSGENARPWSDDSSIELTMLADGSDGPAIRGAVYPRPEYEGELWSQWGQGVVLDDGRFISGIGDHAATDGNSFLYEYNPETDRLTQISDVLSLTDHQDGETGYGKVHAQMVLGPCGEVYAATYWGSQRGVVYEGNYRGDVLLRIDPVERTVENMGVILEEHGVPSMAGWSEGGLLYAEAANPELHDPQRGALAVLDMATGERVFSTEDDQDHAGFRAMAVDQDGRVMFSRDNGSLARWDPATEEVSETDITLPGEFLRASTPAAPDGTVYVATQDPDMLLAIESDDEVRELGAAAGYTASLAMAPDGSKLWYVPDAHGGAAESGTPVIEVDTETGEQRTVVELEPLAREALGMSLGGTYNVAVSHDGTTLYLGLNANEPGADSLFGEVVLVVVELE